MRLINNQETCLFEEFRELLTSDSEIFICSSYISINAFFELGIDLKKVKSINILIGRDISTDTQFVYDSQEYKQFHDLKGKLKAETALSIIKEKCNIRHANVGGQKFILVKNKDKTHCVSIVPHDLNSVCLGVVQNENPIIISSFEDAGDQYTSLFNQFCNNSNKDIKRQVESFVKKACVYHSPDDLYKFSLYNIFQNSTIDEVSEHRLKKIGFKNTHIWGMRFNFQQYAGITSN